MISTLRHAYEHTQGVLTGDGYEHAYRQNGVSKRAAPSPQSYFVWCTSVSTAPCPADFLV